jgi:DNA-directed RNA polymerase specialized sigma24 family protein
MTTLDQLLYAWLAERDDVRFKRAFSAYFSAAFPAVVRYLSRRAVADPTQLEDIAQEALLKFFERVGTGRREASRDVTGALTRLRPLSLGPFHVRQVSVWAGDVESFAAEAMGFHATSLDESGGPAWKAAVHALSDRIPTLQRQGLHLLGAVRVELHVHFPVEADTDDEYGATAFAAQLAREAAEKSTAAVAVEEGYPGVFQFVDATVVVIERLPRLRVPTNGFLFDIALSVYLDDCKSRHRQKRGGGLSGGVAAADSHDGDADQHPLQQVEIEGGSSREALDEQVEVSDSTRRFEDNEFLEKFYVYLRAPVMAAERAYADAADGRAAAQSRKKLESVTAKFARAMTVLSLLGEGHTQEEVAARLSLSRNQVKYIIELVQEAYAHFCATPAEPSTRSALTGESTHVK